MKHHDEDPLLKELLTGEELSEFRRRSLDRGLDAVRRTRRRRKMLHAGALALVPLILGAALWLLRTPPPMDVQVVLPPKPGERQQASAASHPAAVKRISDEELLALFPGRSLALIGPPGHQELLFLDDPAAGNAEGL